MKIIEVCLAYISIKRLIFRYNRSECILYFVKDYQMLQIVVTHPDRFHADDLLATGVLLYLYPHLRVERTRCKSLIGQARFVVDVGEIYDPENGRFDHHQRHSPLRPNNCPYSSLGLVWKSYGQDFVKRVFSENMGFHGYPELSSDQTEQIADLVDQTMIASIDACDTGHFDATETHISRLLERQNGLLSFNDAVTLGQQMMKGIVFHTAECIICKEDIKKALHYRLRPEIIELPRNIVSWRKHVDKDVLFAFYPENKRWMIATMNESGSRIARMFFPEEWRGLSEDELSEVIGFDGCIFVHNAGLVAAHKTKEGAMKMMEKTIEFMRDSLDIRAA